MRVTTRRQLLCISAPHMSTLRRPYVVIMESTNTEDFKAQMFVAWTCLLQHPGCTGRIEYRLCTAETNHQCNFHVPTQTCRNCKPGQAAYRLRAPETPVMLV